MCFIINANIFNKNNLPTCLQKHYINVLGGHHNSLCKCIKLKKKLFQIKKYSLITCPHKNVMWQDHFNNIGIFSLSLAFLKLLIPLEELIVVQQSKMIAIHRQNPYQSTGMLNNHQIAK